MNSKKRYYMPGVDEIHQLVETPESKERTEKGRFIWTLVISIISAVAASTAAIVSIITLASV